MRRHPVYVVLGALLILGAAFADLRGWTLAGAVAARGGGGPRSVRENPGAYRSVYRSSVRFRHGK